MTTTLARMVEEWHDEVPVARVEGEVDASNVHEMGERLRSLLTNRSIALVVDLTATTYLDSAGLNLLFALGEELRGRQQLDKTVPAHTTLAEALGHAAGGQQ